MGIYATNRPLGVGMSNAPPRRFAKKFFSLKLSIQKRLNALRLNDAVFGRPT